MGFLLGEFIMQLKWKCRRGMKELDILMETYFLNEYDHASDERKRAFETLLDYQDPVIIDLLFERYRDDNSEIQALIDILKSYHLNQHI